MGVVLGGVYGLLVLLSIAVVLALTAASNYSNTYALLNDKAVLLMRMLTDRIDLHLKPAEEAVHEVAALYAAHTFDLDKSDERDALVAGMLAASDAFQAILFVDKNFEQQGLYRDSKGEIKPITPKERGDTNAMDLLKSVEADDPFVWGPLVFAAGDSFVNVTAPLVRDRVVDGYVIAAVSARMLSQIVSKVGVEDGATAFVLYGDQGMFARSQADAIDLTAKIDEGKRPVPLAASGDPVLSHFDSRVRLQPFKRAQRMGVEVSEVTDSSGGEFVMLTRKVADYGPVPWVAGLYVPQDQIIDELLRLYGSIAIGVAMLAVSVIVSLLIAHRIGRSLDRLNVEAGRVERFELEAARELPRSRISELDSVSTAFNGMLTALRAFSLYVPRGFVRRLIRLGYEEATRLHRREAAVLFTDIVGFTALSETLSAEEVAEILNGHFAELVACVEAEDGTVDKFIGDSMMAVWSQGTPAENACHAVRAAVRIAAAVTAGNRAREKGRPPMHVRIGVHCGPVIVGNLGAADRVNYTIIGDTVNVASRLEALGKSVAPDDECVILASAHALETVAAAGVSLTVAPIGETSLRGRAETVDVRRVVDCPSLSTSVIVSSVAAE